MIPAVIHVFNEEKNIARCLTSLQFVQEIILIDMGSTDSTCNIAKEYKANIYTHPYTGFVEPARNFGIQKAKNKWILVVDADEEVSPDLARYISSEIKNPRADFYRLARKNIIFNRWIKHAGWWPDYQVRFFKKGMVKWSDKIHGIPETKGYGQDLESEERLAITHFNYQTLDQYLTRLNRYTSIAAKELYLFNRRFKLTDLIDPPSKEFIRRYFVWEGYKDGVHGLALSFLQSFSELVIYLKLWELEGFKEERAELSKIQSYYQSEHRKIQYWFIESLIRSSSNSLQSIVMKLKRKLCSYG